MTVGLRARSCSRCSRRGMLVERPPDGLTIGVPFRVLLLAYRGYLLDERGLSAGTVAQYLRQTRSFLCWLPVSSDEVAAGLAAEQVTTFVMDWCPRRGSAEAKMMVTALRSFLRFLHVHGVKTVQQHRHRQGRQRLAAPSRPETNASGQPAKVPSSTNGTRMSIRGSPRGSG